MRNRRAIAEYLDAPEFRNELQQCSELFATEQKAKKQRQGDLVDGDQTAVVAAEDDEEEDPTPEEEEVQQMNHLLVEDTPNFALQSQHPSFQNGDHEGEAATVQETCSEEGVFN